jgi:hypothetical protein
MGMNSSTLRPVLRHWVRWVAQRPHVNPEIRSHSPTLHGFCPKAFFLQGRWANSSMARPLTLNRSMHTLHKYTFGVRTPAVQSTTTHLRSPSSG